MSFRTHESLRQACPDKLGHDHKICIFGEQYCYTTQFQIKMREKLFRIREDCFKITDANGQHFFDVSITDIPTFDCCF